MILWHACMQNLASKTVKEWNEVVDKLEHQLIWLEMQLVEQLDVCNEILEGGRDQMFSFPFSRRFPKILS